MATALTGEAAGPDTAVMAVHAEVEGGPYRDFLDDLLPRLKEGCDVIRPVREVAAELTDAPVIELAYTALPGRSGSVATAGPV